MVLISGMFVGVLNYFIKLISVLDFMLTKQTRKCNYEATTRQLRLANRLVYRIDKRIDYPHAADQLMVLHVLRIERAAAGQLC